MWLTQNRAKDHPLWYAPNVVITPHVAGFSELKFERAWLVIHENLRRSWQATSFSPLSTSNGDIEHSSRRRVLILFYAEAHPDAERLPRFNEPALFSCVLVSRVDADLTA